MLEKDFDQIIRDQFEDHSSPVPADMWQRIKSKDDKDRKPLFFWKWYFLGPAFLALSLVGGQLFFHPATHIHPAVPVMTLARTASPAAPAAPTSNDATRPRLQSIQNEYSPVTLAKIAALAKTAKPATPAGSSAPAATAGSADPTPASATSAAPASNDAGRPRAQSSQNANPPATPPVASNASTPRQPSDRPSPPPTPPATAGTHQPQSLSCPDPSKRFTRSKGWYLEALGSPDYPLPRSSLDGSSIQELPRLSYTVGIRVTKIFESGFLITAGLQYSWINLRNKYDSLPLPDHFRNLDLPLLIGYEKGNDLFKFGIRGGMIFNIHSWPGGDQYFGNYLKSNTGLSSYIGIELIRQINDRISIFAEPYYKHQFSDMFKNPFVEKIDVTGIFLGIRFTLKPSSQ
jgi:hypothetical protein